VDRVSEWALDELEKMFTPTFTFDDMAMKSHAAGQAFLWVKAVYALHRGEAPQIVNQIAPPATK